MMRQSDLRFQQQSTVTNALPITPSVRAVQMPGEAGPTTENVCHRCLAFGRMEEHRPRPGKAQIDTILICCQQANALINDALGNGSRICSEKRPYRQKRFSIDASSPSRSARELSCCGRGQSQQVSRSSRRDGELASWRDFLDGLRKIAFPLKERCGKGRSQAPVNNPTRSTGLAPRIFSLSVQGAAWTGRSTRQPARRPTLPPAIRPEPKGRLLIALFPGS
jgi:hypothetical protein